MQKIADLLSRVWKTSQPASNTDLVDGVWVAHPRCALPVAVALRQTLIEVNSSRLVQQGQQTKMEQVYHYLTGTKFKQRVDAVIEKFNDMRADLDKERKLMTTQPPR